MFDQYAAKLKQYKANVPKVFSKVAKKTAIKAENTAKSLTDNDGLIDTGAYKGAWEAHPEEIDKGIYAVYLNNSMDYSSFLEKGYTLNKNVFVPFDKMEGTPKTKAFIARIKAKYPNAKGFLRKAGRYKGHFIGRQSLDEAHYYAIQQLDKEMEKAFIAYNQSFTKD